MTTQDEYKYIIAKELLAKVKNITDSPFISKSELRNIIGEMPDLVRCKNCKHHHKGRCPMYGDYQDWADDDDFCSRGEWDEQDYIERGEEFVNQDDSGLYEFYLEHGFPGEIYE